MKGPPLPPPRHPTLHRALAAAARSELGITFIDADETETFLSYAAILRAARRFAHGLGRAGVRRGDRVALVLPTSPVFPTAFFGALLAGAVPVPLYPPLRLGNLAEFHARTARMLAVAACRLAVADARISRLLGVAVERARPELGLRTVDDITASAKGEGALPANPDDLALVQFSSGTTVDPKPVALTHRAILANITAIDRYLGEEGPVSGASWLPLYHDMGLVGGLLGALAHPAPLALIPPEAFLARPALWLRAIGRHRATVSPAPNFAFGHAARRIRDEELAGIDLSSWRLALCGAEPVSPSVLRRFTERFAPYGLDPAAPTPVYGLSEATLAVTFGAARLRFATATVDPPRPSRDGPREFASVGRPVAGMEVEIRDAGGAALPDGRAGRIWVRGPSLMQGYLGNDAATREVLRDGWLDTGDLGFARDGELYVTGRARDTIVLRGQNHAPEEFEEAAAVAGVRAGGIAAVGFVPVGAEGEELAILAEHEQGETPPVDLGERVRAAVLERTGIRPFEVRILAPGTLPRTSSGKLRRGEARRRLLAGRLAAPAKVTPLRIAGEVLRSRIALVRAKIS